MDIDFHEGIGEGINKGLNEGLNEGIKLNTTGTVMPTPTSFRIGKTQLQFN